MAEVKSQYKDLISWADMFEGSNNETKRMITSYLINRVEVKRGYEINIKFNIAYENFCEVLVSENEAVNLAI